MSEHYDFHYQPTGSGAISGQQVLQQTEDAINELGDYVNDNVGGAMDVAQQALETAQTAEQDAQTALDTANSFSSAIQSAQQDASTALSTAQTAQTTASNANNTAIQASQDASSAVTTANNASGQVNTLSGTVTALGQRVTTAEGNIGQNTSDITALTTRVGTAEGNITTLQNDVTIAQGNASSAMATAGQVKQQAFVFRYSSTVLTASSTNSNTLLDNTDNLKVGDKVIDSSGVLFSITAIDTANSTFTIGTALIDLAQDSDVVHKSGNETIGGVKTFTNDISLKSLTGEYTVSSGNTSLLFYDKNSLLLSQYKQGVFSSGMPYQYFSILGYDSNNQQSITFSGSNLNLSTAYLRPDSDNAIDLGRSNNRWSRVYAIKYYYGSDNVEFSDKFVTTDTAQTIGGSKTFLSSPTIYNPDTSAYAAYLNLQNQRNVRGSTTDTGAQGIQFQDKNGKTLTMLESRVISTGSTGFNIICYNTDGNNQNVTDGVSVIKTPSATSFSPITNNAVTCGRALAKWSGVYSTEYYYGANNTPFSTKFVTTDTAQAISGSKTFSSNVNVYNSDSSTDTANIVLKNGKVERGSTTNIGEQNISFVDKNNAQIGNIKCITNSSGVSNMYITCNASGSVQGVRVSRSPNITYFRSTADNDCKLGTSDVRWSDVQTYKVNNLEPSSLSLPSDRSARIDISSYITNLGNGDNNTYTVPANGYIWLRFTSINSALCYSQTSGGLTNYAQTFARYQGDGQLYAFFPVRKDDNFIVQVWTSSTAVVENAYFIPCKGNV